jgi:hypothetical protein
MSNTGIIYGLTGERARGDANTAYHRKPNALFLNKTSHKIDVSGLKNSDQRDAIKFDGMEYASRFTVGFEVEKNQLSRNAVREYELFCGFERDGSCGYEAVTHVLPLLPAGKWRTKVFDMMHKAEKIIDDRFSPSDKRCGGHITVAVDGLDGEELRERVRKNCGIVYALFRNRLKNHYCGFNKRMQSEDDARQWHYKYQLALVKGNCLEFRLPSRFESVKQMMRRYELFYELLNFSVNNPTGTHDSFLRKIKPIVLSMYNGDEEKTKQILSLSKEFRTYILRGDISDKVREFI